MNNNPLLDLTIEQLNYIYYRSEPSSQIRNEVVSVMAVKQQSLQWERENMKKWK